MSLGREEIARLLPHAGAMCLLEEVVEWNDTEIVCRTTSHHDAANPLRGSDGVSALMGVEYAAQAVAVHGGLSRGSAGKPRIGYLAALRDVVCSADRLDTEAGDLVVRATQVAAEAGRLLYDFRVEAGGRELLKGRLAVVIP